ncbi:MAG: peptidoglycan editing factor PgeF [Clostridiales bacterium]|jgi:YfiH family protein|nr:peptidoglycan editing factor PgeF [Clostridiales bacterium]
MEKETIIHRQGVSFLSYRNLTDKSILHGFSLRHGGQSRTPYDTLNLGLHVADNQCAVLENRRRFAEAIGYAPEAVVTGQQVHGHRVTVVTARTKGRGHLQAADAIPGTDGLVTVEPEIVLMAHSADCTVLFFYDPVHVCIGLAHAGWRGAVAGMGPAMIDAMAVQGCLRENIRVALSPTIGPCCYRVGVELTECVPHKYQQTLNRRKDGEIFFNLPELQQLSLLDAGVSKANIITSRYCTHCHTDLFFSHRAAGGVTGRMAGVISLQKQE